MPRTLSRMLLEQAVLQTGDMPGVQFGHHRQTYCDPEFQAEGYPSSGILISASDQDFRKQSHAGTMVPPLSHKVLASILRGYCRNE
jgi:hypothetical protein